MFPKTKGLSLEQIRLIFDADDVPMEPMQLDVLEGGAGADGSALSDEKETGGCSPRNERLRAPSQVGAVRAGSLENA